MEQTFASGGLGANMGQGEQWKAFEGCYTIWNKEVFGNLYIRAVVEVHTCGHYRKLQVIGVHTDQAETAALAASGVPVRLLLQLACDVLSSQDKRHKRNAVERRIRSYWHANFGLYELPSSSQTHPVLALRLL